MIDKQTRDSIMARENALRQWLREHKTSCYRPQDVAHLNQPTNDERSAVEFFDFVMDPPERYFLYITGNIATTWTGEKLGDVTFGTPYRDNFGGWRVPIRVFARNGFEYFGTYFKSSGDYARIRRCKRQKFYQTPAQIAA